MNFLDKFKDSEELIENGINDRIPEILKTTISALYLNQNRINFRFSWDSIYLEMNFSGDSKGSQYDDFKLKTELFFDFLKMPSI